MPQRSYHITKSQLPIHSILGLSCCLCLSRLVNSVLLFWVSVFNQFHWSLNCHLLSSSIHCHLWTLHTLQNLHEMESHCQWTFSCLRCRNHQRLCSFGTHSFHIRNSIKQKFSLYCQKHSLDNGLHHNYSFRRTNANFDQMFHGKQNKRICPNKHWRDITSWPKERREERSRTPENILKQIHEKMANLWLSQQKVRFQNVQKDHKIQQSRVR